jgi:hypothetical protein
MILGRFIGKFINKFSCCWLFVRICFTNSQLLVVGGWEANFNLDKNRLFDRLRVTEARSK